MKLDVGKAPELFAFINGRVQVRVLLVALMKEDKMHITNIDGKPVTEIPESLAQHVGQWLSSNEKECSQVLHGIFPLGMVQRWIERALEAEAKLKQTKRNEEIENLLEQIDSLDRNEFRKYVGSGEASAEFIAKYDKSELYQEIGIKVLVKLFEPFAKAIKDADARVLENRSSTLVGNGSVSKTDALKR